MAERFPDSQVRKSIALDLALIDCLGEQIVDVELYLKRTVKVEDTQLLSFAHASRCRAHSALVLLYENHRIDQFADEWDFLSYARLVRCQYRSANKRVATGGKKIGNADLKGALSEAVCLLIRSCPAVKAWRTRPEKKRGQKKTLAILAAMLRWAVYLMLHRKVAFDVRRFLGQ